MRCGATICWKRPPIRRLRSAQLTRLRFLAASHKLSFDSGGQRLAPAAFDEMHGDGSATRDPYARVAQWLAETPDDYLQTRRAQAELGLTSVMWTTIGYDWKLGAGDVAARMTTHAASGSILCLHDGRELRVKPDIGATVEAVRRLVPVLLDQGYRFETVSQLLCPTNSPSAC